MMPCPLRYDHLREILEQAIAAGYTFHTCAGYATRRPEDDLTAVLRHDIDIVPERAPAMAELEADLGIAATYFFRLHANEYNALSHENLAIMRDIVAMGHEVGLHAEPLDLDASCGVDPATSVRVGVQTLSDLLGVPVLGAASHNDITPDNNLDFFRATPPADLGLAYEAYDEHALNLFGTGWYVTDGYFWRWRAFDRGRLTDNQDCLCKHIAAARTPLYCLFHPHLWYGRHPHRIRY
ncbi:hypothetical protein ACFWRG_20270 [Micromonospora tulbaghiae]|uniref:hypothetical protein n=1 Tax=Micromonospora tulbaghiae TaxID=479978 RepID=UPI003401A2BA